MRSPSDAPSGRSSSVERLRALLVAGLVAVLVAACGGNDGPSRAEVQAALDDAVSAGVPGIALRIRGPEGEEFLTAGVASIEDGRPIEPEDRSRIASVTKAFTAALVMSLVEAGDLGLGDRAEDHVPGLLAHGGRVTVEQMLRHTSGLPDYVEDEEFLRRAVAGEEISPREAVELVADGPLEFDPGSEYDYSDTDNLVLGLIVERITGSSFEEELGARVLEPLGLEQTTLASRPGELPDPHLDGYQHDPDEGEPVNVTGLPLDPNAAWASGALVSTTDDVATFFSALMDGSIVGSEQLDAMRQVVPGAGSPPGPGTNSSGLGIFRYELDCGVVWGHTGSWPGYRTLGVATADGEGAVAMLANATELPDDADAAIVRAQELAACRALGEPPDSDT